MSPTAAGEETSSVVIIGTRAEVKISSIPGPALVFAIEGPLILWLGGWGVVSMSTIEPHSVLMLTKARTTRVSACTRGAN